MLRRAELPMHNNREKGDLHGLKLNRRVCRQLVDRFLCVLFYISIIWLNYYNYIHTQQNSLWVPAWRESEQTLLLLADWRISLCVVLYYIFTHLNSLWVPAWRESEQTLLLLAGWQISLCTVLYVYYIHTQQNSLWVPAWRKSEQTLLLLADWRISLCIVLYINLLYHTQMSWSVTHQELYEFRT